MKHSLFKYIIFLAILSIIVYPTSVSCKPINNTDSTEFDYSRLGLERFLLETSILNDVWGSSPSNVFVVGENGAIYNYDGNSWEKMDSPVSASINGIWGTSSSNVYAVTQNGGILHFDGDNWAMVASYENYRFNGIWGSSESDIFAVGFEGIILHYDGHNWDTTTLGDTYHVLNIWGTSSTNVYAVGPHETVLHYDGVGWSIVTTEEESGHMYSGVWGSGPDNVMVTGGSFDAKIIRYDGEEWDTMKVNSKYRLLNISGSSDSNVFAVGSNGNVMHFNGKEWSSIGDTEANFNDAYTGVWTYSLSDTFIVGLYGVVLHYSYKP